MASKGIRRLKINELGPDSSNFFVVGIIIRKQEPRVVTLKRDNNEKSVWCFTLRDTPSDYINANIWGSTEYITNLNIHFQVGDVVDIIDPKLSFRRVGDYDEKYNPSVTSSFYLTLNEKKSEICLHDSEECRQFLPLLRLPTKPLGNFFNLADIHSNVNVLSGQYVNLQAAVRNIGEKRKITTKNGKELESREILLMDQTSQELSMQIWDGIISTMADNWIARKTVLFLADVRIDWNKFKRSAVAVVTSCTIVTVDPETLDAEKLRTYIRTAVLQPVAILDNIVSSIRDPDTITTVMSCNGVLKKATETEQKEEFTALVYAIIHQFDIDGTIPLSAFRCLNCNMKVPPGSGICTNTQCPSGSGLKPSSIQVCFNIHIRLVDHTGSLPYCRINDSVAQKMLKCKITEFEKLSLEMKTQLKWKYLLKPCIARLVVLPSKGMRSPLISTVSIDGTSLAEYSTRLPMY